MNSDLYQHILDTTLRETMEYYDMDWSTAYFQHDGDPKHRSKSTIQWLNANGVNYIDDWPAQSPDLNPIEHLWHHLKLKLSLYDKKAKGVHELWERVEKEWNSFDKEVCRRYIDTMPARTLGEKIGTTFSKNSFHAAYSIKRRSPHVASNMLKRG